MANELQLAVNLISYSKSGVTAGPTTTSVAATISGTGYKKEIISVGTVEEAVSLGDIANLGYVKIRNLDATNYVTVDSVTGNTGARVPKQGTILWYPNNNALYLKANTAACLVEVEMFPQ